MYISIDFGASKTRVGFSDDLTTFQHIERFETQEDFNRQVSRLNEVILSRTSESSVTKVCLGIAGLIDKKENKMIKSPNYSQMDGRSLTDVLPESYRKATLITENDAALGGLGEAFFGAGKNFNTVAYLTLSSGVGGVRVHKQKNKFSYFSAEPGHQIILEDGKLDQTTGLFGSLQSYCSGRAFKEIFGDSPWDSEDKEAWAVYAKHLSTGIINVISMWMPDVIVLGGGMVHKFDSFYVPLMSELQKQKLFEIPQIVKSDLEDDSGIYGGLVIMKENI